MNTDCLAFMAENPDQIRWRAFRQPTRWPETGERSRDERGEPKPKPVQWTEGHWQAPSERLHVYHCEQNPCQTKSDRKRENEGQGGQNNRSQQFYPGQRFARYAEGPDRCKLLLNRQRQPHLHHPP